MTRHLTSADFPRQTYQAPAYDTRILHSYHMAVMQDAFESIVNAKRDERATFMDAAIGLSNSRMKTLYQTQVSPVRDIVKAYNRLTQPTVGLAMHIDMPIEGYVYTAIQDVADGPGRLVERVAIDLITCGLIVHPSALPRTFAYNLLRLSRKITPGTLLENDGQWAEHLEAGLFERAGELGHRIHHGRHVRALRLQACLDYAEMWRHVEPDSMLTYESNVLGVPAPNPPALPHVRDRQTDPR